MDVVFNDTATHESYTDWHTLSLHGALPDCGSGAVQCAAALGLWKVLRRENIDIDMVVGCSGGSIYASVMALGYDPETCERLTRELWTPKVTLRRDWRSMLGALMPRLFGFDGQARTGVV